MRFESVMRQQRNNTGIEVPEEVVEALGGGKRAAVVVTVNGFEYRARAAFDALSPSARKAHVTNVDAAKAAETRTRRISAIVSGLGG